MALIRAKLSFRILFLILVVSLFGLSVWVFRTEGMQDWKAFQKQYQAKYQELLMGNIRKAKEQGDKAGLEKWDRLLGEADNLGECRIEQVFLPDAGVRDLCQTCHIAMENPLFKDAPNPLRSHPEWELATHKPSRFGCTLCHHGQGVGLHIQKAHGLEENWPFPRVPKRYVQGLCLGCHETPLGLKGAEKAEAGRKLFVEHGCYSCHEARTLKDLPYMSPPFEGVGKKIADTAWLFQWIKEPPSIRPRTRMPTYRFKIQDIRDIASYLALQKEMPKELSSHDRKNASASNGKTLFVDKGCIGCHSDRRDEACLSDRVPNLGDGRLKLNRQWIVTWLEDPGALNSETPMPRLMLTDEERGDLAAYIKSLADKSVARLLESIPKNAWEKGVPEEGKRLVQVMGCYGCHRVKEMDQLALPGVQVAEVARKRLEELPFGNSQVPQTKWDWLFHKIKQPAVYETKDMPLKMPDFKVSDGEVELLTIFYLNNDYYHLPEHYLSKSNRETTMQLKGEWMVGHYNCTGCHQLTKDAQPRIQSHLVLKSLAPPTLVGEAERVQPQWFFQYVSKPVELRPWLKIRMPEFKWAYQDLTNLIEYFTLQLDLKTRQAVTVPYVLLPLRSDYDPEILEMGKYRVQTDKCMQCHPVSLDDKLPEGVKLEDLSINLMLAKSRLRFEWIKNFLRNPDLYAGKGTKMPFAYYTPDRVPRVPNPEMWIQYASLYLMFMDKVPEVFKEKKIEEIRPGADTDWTRYN
jgi:mono/diheme cytochrome c family protein